MFPALKVRSLNHWTTNKILSTTNSCFYLQKVLPSQIFHPQSTLLHLPGAPARNESSPALSPWLIPLTGAPTPTILKGVCAGIRAPAPWRGLWGGGRLCLQSSWPHLSHAPWPLACCRCPKALMLLCVRLAAIHGAPVSRAEHRG